MPLLKGSSKKVVSVERLRFVLDYNPDTGLFRHKIWRSSCCPGKEVGHPQKSGYVRIRIDKRLYLAHRLAWLWMTGEWPKEIDHKDLNKSNNKWNNLRAATRSQNSCNNNGLGVYLHRTGKYAAQIKLNGKVTHLGLYASKEAALAIRAAAEKRVFGDFARMRQCR